ncbi:hypothetical protein [Paraburkholderia youngii]|uniref:hypothetical protein n=1 Tax=Paraburkholderia youngii TaxID=2782701 RepID=UPI003D232CDD
MEKTIMPGHRLSMAFKKWMFVTFITLIVVCGAIGIAQEQAKRAAMPRLERERMARAAEQIVSVLDDDCGRGAFLTTKVDLGGARTCANSMIDADVNAVARDAFTVEQQAQLRSMALADFVGKAAQQ